MPILIGLLLAPLVFAANNTTNKQPVEQAIEQLCGPRPGPQGRLEIRHMYDMGKEMNISAKMEGVIETAKKYGADTSELEAIKSEIMDKFRNINTENIPQYNRVIKEIGKQIRAFRQKAHNITELQGKGDEVRENIKKHAEKVSKEVKEKIKEAKSTATEVALRVFDLHICIAENHINRLVQQGLNTSSLSAKLGEMKAERSNLESALNSSDRERIKAEYEKIKGLWKELRKVYVQVQRTRALKFVDKIVEKTEKLIDKLNSHNQNEAANEIQGKLDEVKSIEGEISSDVTNGDFEAAKNASIELRSVTKELRETINKWLKELRPFKKGMINKTERMINKTRRIINKSVENIKKHTQKWVQNETPGINSTAPYVPKMKW